MNLVKPAAFAVGLSLIGTAAFAAEACCCKDKDAKMACCEKDAGKPDAGKPSAPSDNKDHQH